jgi:hypothetical protein
LYRFPSQNLDFDEGRVKVGVDLLRYLLERILVGDGLALDLGSHGGSSMMFFSDKPGAILLDLISP